MSEPIVSRETLQSTAADNLTCSPKTIVILSGGATFERDISLRSAHHLSKTLTKLGHRTFNLHPDQDLIKRLREIKPDLVWPVMHGGIGEDGSLQTLLELLRIPFIGSSADAASLASSKPTAKAMLRQANIHTPKSVTLPRSLFSQIGAADLISLISERFRFPQIVKPVDGGSALGVSKVNTVESLRSALVEAFSYSESALLEEFIEGKEIAVSLVDFEGETVVLPPVEIATESGAYDFDARYSTGRSVFYAPARLSDEELKTCSNTALSVAKVLNLQDLARIDLILDDAGQAWFIDANVSPGMTETSLFPQAARAYNSFSQVISQLVASKLSKD